MQKRTAWVKSLEARCSKCFQANYPERLIISNGSFLSCLAAIQCGKRFQVIRILDVELYTMNEINKARVICEFLAYYESDLRYFKMFKEFKAEWQRGNSNAINIYTKSRKEKGLQYSLYNYVDYLNVQWGLTQDNRRTIWSIFMNEKYFNRCDLDAVSDLMKRINGGILTGNRISLCSKLMMLMQPTIFFPFDRFVKVAINYEGEANYPEFHNQLGDVCRDNDYLILRNALLAKVEEYTRIIEAQFSVFSNPEIQIIRENRMLDKMLWVIGKYEGS